MFKEGQPCCTLLSVGKKQIILFDVDTGIDTSLTNTPSITEPHPVNHQQVHNDEQPAIPINTKQHQSTQVPQPSNAGLQSMEY